MTKKSLLIADGAMGTELMSLGFDPRVAPLCVANLTHPEVVAGIHENYVKAGAEILYTNSFGADFLSLKNLGHETSWREITINAVTLAKKVSGANLVYASLCPPPSTNPDESRLESLSAQMQLLHSLGVDGLVVETITNLHDAGLALKALAQAKIPTDFNSILSFSFGENECLQDGAPLTQVATLVQNSGLKTIGLNCLTGPTLAVRLALKLKDSGLKLVVKPNAGLPHVAACRLTYPIDADEFTATLLPVLDFVAVVGGCCGTTPEHIKYLAKRVKNAR